MGAFIFLTPLALLEFFKLTLESLFLLLLTDWHQSEDDDDETSVQFPITSSQLETVTRNQKVHHATHNTGVASKAIMTHRFFV